MSEYETRKQKCVDGACLTQLYLQITYKTILMNAYVKCQEFHSFNCVRVVFLERGLLHQREAWSRT